MIEIEHLSKRFGDLVAVDDLSLSIPAGQLFCFLGPNGAGKTTTIKLMCGLLKPSSGSIRIAGLSIFEDLVELRRITGYIPDTPFLYERLTVTEFYLFTGDLYGLPRAAVEAGMDEAFAQFGLADHRAALIRDLSHGYRQRMIRATLLHEPRVLFIDEPRVTRSHSIRLIWFCSAEGERRRDHFPDNPYTGAICGTPCRPHRNHLRRPPRGPDSDELRMQSSVQGRLGCVSSLTREG